MTNQNGKSKLQRFIQQRSQSGQRQSIADLLKEIDPEDPIRPIVQAIESVQQDISEVRLQVDALAESNTDSKSIGDDQGLSKDQLSKLKQQLGSAIETAAEAVAKHKERDYAFRWLSAAAVLGLVAVLGGGAIGYWISDFRSAEARQHWDWNKKLIQECKKQNKPTCNVHTVEPEILWHLGK